MLRAVSARRPDRAPVRVIVRTRPARTASLGQGGCRRSLAVWPVLRRVGASWFSHELFGRPWPDQPERPAAEALTAALSAIGIVDPMIARPAWWAGCCCCCAGPRHSGSRCWRSWRPASSCSTGRPTIAGPGARSTSPALRHRRGCIARPSGLRGIIGPARPDHVLCRPPGRISGASGRSLPNREPTGTSRVHRGRLHDGTCANS